MGRSCVVVQGYFFKAGSLDDQSWISIPDVAEVTVQAQVAQTVGMRVLFFFPVTVCPASSKRHPKGLKSSFILFNVHGMFMECSRRAPALRMCVPPHNSRSGHGRPASKRTAQMRPTRSLGVSVAVHGSYWHEIEVVGCRAPL
jgi:hypothetical protein